jgi:hypothetical protein
MSGIDLSVTAHRKLPTPRAGFELVRDGDRL